MPDVGRGGTGGKSVANITHHLKGINFPAKRDDLVKQAKKNGAESDVLDVIKNLPDKEYRNMADVMRDYGEAERKAA